MPVTVLARRYRAGGALAAAAFDLGSVAGIIQRLDASSLAATAALSTWPDSGGSGRDATVQAGSLAPSVVAGASPTGLSAVRYRRAAGVNTGLIHVTSGGIGCVGGFSIYWAFNATTLVNAGQVLEQTAWRWYHDQGGDFGGNGVVSVTQSACVDYGATVHGPQVLSLIFTGCGATGSGAMQRDGTALSGSPQAYNGIGLVGISPGSSVYIGNASNLVEPMDADLYERLWCSGVHDAATQAAIVGALQTKWGV